MLTPHCGHHLTGEGLPQVRQRQLEHPWSTRDAGPQAHIKSVPSKRHLSWLGRSSHPALGNHLISPETVFQGSSCSGTDKNLTKMFSTVSWE